MTENTGTTELEQQTPSEPTLPPEQVAAYLGVDPEYLDTVRENAKNAEALLKKAQQEKSRTARERAELQREIEEAKKAQPKLADDEVELDETAKRILNRYIEEQIAPLKQEQEQRRQREIEGIVAEFEAAHPKADLEAIGTYLEEIGAAPQTPAQLKKAMEAANRVLFDDPAEQVRAELEKAKGTDGKIVEIRGKGTPVEDTRPPWERTRDVPLAELRRELFRKRNQ